MITFVNLITECCRATDILARLGGDEFSLLLPNSPRKKLFECADRSVYEAKKVNGTCTHFSNKYRTVGEGK